MRIGYDAKRFFSNATGLGNYSRTLIETLAKYHSENEYHLFAPKNDASERVNFIKQYPSVLTHFPEGFYQKIHPLWRSYFIKNDLQNAHIPLFHGLSGELPLSVPKGVKTVVTIHDLIHERYPQYYPFFDRKMYRWKFKSACERADQIVAISEQTKRDIVDFYKIEASKIKVIYQSCHPQFRAVNTSNLGADYFFQKYKLPKNYLLYVGTINARKNLLGILKAFKTGELSRLINLVVVGQGGGRYFAEVASYIIDNKLKNRIVSIPNLDFEDFPHIYKNALALVYPSFSEGFGIPIIEALWSGCPVITSAGGCFAEAGGLDTLYVNPHDPQDIATAICNLSEDNALRKRMILRGLEYVQKFEEQSIGNQWIALYESLYPSVGG